MKIEIYSTSTLNSLKFKNWFSYLQKIFSNYIRKRLHANLTFNEIPTHVSIYSFSALGRDFMIEARAEGTELSLYEKGKWTFEFFTEIYDEEIINKMIDEYLHDSYNYISLLIFPKRWFLHFFADDRKAGLLSKWGKICTGDAYSAIQWNLSKLSKSDAEKYLTEWNSYSVFAIEILQICEYLSLNGIGKLIKNY